MAVASRLASPINIKGVSKSVSTAKKSLNQTTNSFKKISEILVKKTKVRRQIFDDTLETKRKRENYTIRKEEEDRLEAPNAVKSGDPSQVLPLIQSSGRSFFGRIISTLGYLAAGWVLRNLPTWVALGREFIVRIEKAGNIIKNFVSNTINVFTSTYQVLDGFRKNIMTFDLFDDSNRVKNSFDELKTSIDNMGIELENAIKLITTPLTQTTAEGTQEGTYSGEEVPGLGTTSQDNGAYSGTPAPQVMLEGGISGTTALLPAGAKGADRNVGATDRFGYSSSRGRQHNGIDIGTSKQKGYYVAFLLDGTATLGNQPKGAGLFVEIKSGGTTYKFFHLAKISIKAGPYKAGTAIGEIGSTGSSTSEHLHYEVWPPGTRGVNPEPYLNLIKIGKNLGKPIAAPASVSSSSTSQPQQNLMGTPSSSSSGGGRYGTKEERSLLDAISFAEGTKSSYGTMFGGGISKDLESGKLTVKQVIDLGDAHAKKNGRSGAAGRYQFMPFTLEDLVRTGDLKMDDKFTSQMQDKAALALARRRKVTSELLKKEGLSAKVSNMLAPEWASLPTYSGASYYGQPVKSLSSIQSVYKKSLGAPQQAQVATPQSSPSPAQTSTPANPSTPAPPPPAQISPTFAQQNQQQVAQQITPERRGQDVVAIIPQQQAAGSPQSASPASSAGGGSSAPSMFDVLNTFMKQKLLLDLAYL